MFSDTELTKALQCTGEVNGYTPTMNSRLEVRDKKLFCDGQQVTNLNFCLEREEGEEHAHSGYVVSVS